MILNENFVFSRPLTVTGAILYQNESDPVFHQMTLDRIENGEYILQNTQFSADLDAGMVLFIFSNRFNHSKIKPKKFWELKSRIPSVQIMEWSTAITIALGRESIFDENENKTRQWLFRKHGPQQMVFALSSLLYDTHDDKSLKPYTENLSRK